MALLFLDSFDHYATADAGEKWDATHANSGFTIAAGEGRFGTHGFHCTDGNAYLGKGTNPGSQTAIWGFSFRVRSQLGQFVFTETYDAVNDEPLIVFTCNVDGSLTAWRTSDSAGSAGSMSAAFATILGTTRSALIGAGVTNFVECKVVHHDTLGSVEIHVNGEEVLNVPTIDTRPALRNYTMIGIGMSVTAALVDFDDVYMADDLPGLVDDFIGDHRIGCKFADANGPYSEMTTSNGSPNHYDMVNETEPNDDIDYVSGVTVGLREINHYPPLLVTGTVKGVQVNLSARKNDAGTKTIAVMYQYLAADAVGPDLYIATEAYRYYRGLTENNPLTAAPWTIAQVNATYFGGKITS